MATKSMKLVYFDKNVAYSRGETIRLMSAYFNLGVEDIGIDHTLGQEEI